MYVKPQILIVDDDINLNKTLSDIFRRQGYEPTVILRGRDALDTVGKKSFDIALLDLKLEDMPGMEIMREIKRNHPDIECIVLTGHSSTDSTIEAIKLGAYAYIQKPYGMEQLLTIIRCAMGKRKVVDALRVSEEKSRAIIEASKDAMVAIDDKGLITIFNPAAEKLFGRRAEEMEGRPLDLLLPGEYREKHRENLKSYFSTGKPDGAIGKTVELSALHSSGRIVPVDLTLSPGTIKKSNFVLAVIRDITERKIAEEEIRESELKYKTLYDTSRDAIMLMVPEKGYLSGNEATLRMFGCIDEEEFKCHTPVSLSPEYQSDGQLSEVKAMEMLSIALKEGSNFFEWTHKRVNGEEFFATVLLARMELRGKMIVQATLRDITASKKAAEALKESEERHRSIVDTATDAIITVDSDGRIVFWNPGAERIFNYSKEEALYESLSMIIPKEHRGSGDIDILHQIISMGKVIGNRVELMGIRKGEEKFPMELSLGTWFSKETPFFTLIIRDISDRKKLESSLLKEKLNLEEAQKELINKHRELEEINRELKETQMIAVQREKLASIGQLAAGVAHEINNPMGFISGNLRALNKYINKFTEFIEIQEKLLKSTGNPEVLEVLKEKRKKLKLDYIIEDVTDLIAESLEGADRVAKIVRDLKGFSRVDEAEYKPADINECIESTLNIVWNEIKYKATVKKDYGNLPYIKCYPQQLNQVFMNLLVNAPQAIEKEGEIRIRTWQEGEAIFISISDTGCGIPEENLKKLFEPFFTTKEVGKGTGLGLSITYDIVKKHGGEIIVDSTVGKGTTFTIKLPVA